MTEQETNRPINIDVETAFLADQSDPAEERYVFAYTITIRNEGPIAVELRTRKWIITDAQGKVQLVEGEGVVGEQPKILPGKSHRYSSGAVLETPVGTMEGSYGMVDSAGLSFDAPIPVFRLAMPEF